MLATRIIPVLLRRESKLVKGVGFDSWRTVGHALQAARVHQMRGVDELVVIDIGATPDHREPDAKLTADLAQDCFMPLTVGGGIRTIEHVESMFRNGADKVLLGTAAIDDPDLIGRIATRYGRQAVTVSVDVGFDGNVWGECGKRVTGMRPTDYAETCEARGAGEILLNSIPRDGTMEGYDLDLIERVSRAVSVPVIALGGCGRYQHMADALRAGAHAVAAGAMFQFTEATPKGAAHWLAEQGFVTRLVA
jgi:imidazole glycerol-phosphate synthase subunit HisF